MRMGVVALVGGRTDGRTDGQRGPFREREEGGGGGKNCCVGTGEPLLPADRPTDPCCKNSPSRSFISYLHLDPNGLAMNAIHVFLLSLALLAASAEALYGGFGGVVGKLTPRTGSKWPPFRGAGQGEENDV